MKGITKYKVGLALGGGAILGAAHVGVLKAIAEHKIKIDYISGTSIGAVVASFYAFGKSWEEIRIITKDLTWIDITSLSLSKFSLLSNDKLATFVTDEIGDLQIEDAKIPLGIVTTDGKTGKKLVLRKGSLADAIKASTAIPGIFHPLKKDEKILIDGGIAENVPVQSVQEMGANYIIAVDLNASNDFKTPTNIVDILLNSFHFLMKNAGKGETSGADVIIQPGLSSFNYTSMSQIDALIERGYNDAKVTLDKD